MLKRSFDWLIHHLYQVNSLLFTHSNIWKFEKVEILQISQIHRYMIYTNKGMLLATLSYDTCDVIPCVCPVIGHGSRPMKALEFLTLLYNSKWFHRILKSACATGKYSRWMLLPVCFRISTLRNQEISVSKTINIIKICDAYFTAYNAWCNIWTTRASVSPGYPNTRKQCMKTRARSAGEFPLCAHSSLTRNFMSASAEERVACLYSNVFY
jgi:hypothetical protein